MSDSVPFWAVWCPEHGPPTKYHLSKQSAETEAMRLAKHHPGKEFFVLMPVVKYGVNILTETRFKADDIPF